MSEQNSTPTPRQLQALKRLAIMPVSDPRLSIGIPTGRALIRRGWARGWFGMTITKLGREVLAQAEA